MRESGKIPGSFAISWEQRKLDDVAQTFKSGNSLKADEIDITGDYPVYGGNGLRGYTSTYNHDGEYALIGRQGALCGNMNYSVGKAYFTEHAVVVKADENNDTRFLYYMLDTMNLGQYSDQSAQPGLAVNKLVKLENRFPTKEEQQRMGWYFSNLDHLITLHQRKLRVLCILERLLYENIKQFEVTVSWEQRKAKELFVSTADKGYPELPVLSATQDRGMIRRDENSINIFHDKKNEAGYKRVLPGQFVIHLRSFQGGFAHSAIEGITSPAYTVFGFSEPEKHDSEYWKYVFTSKSFIRRLETVTYGIRDGRSISYEEFLTLGFVYPSKAEQTAIARYLDKLSHLITLHQRKP